MTEPALSPEEFVRRLYQLVLKRAADAGGLDYWVGRMRESGDPSLVLKALMESDEYRSQFRPVRRHAATAMTAGSHPVAYGAIAGLSADRRGRLRSDLELIVPVCNAAHWIEEVCAAYEAVDLDPLFI